MSIDPQVIRSERHKAVGTLIQRDAGILLERWCRRAVEEEPRATRVHHEVLRDQLASFLWALGHSLAESAEADTEAHCRPALEHGAQRWESGWSLPEVVRDYQILRLVILEYLHEMLDRPLREREIMAVSLALDEAIAASVGAYFHNRAEYVRQIEQKRHEQDKSHREALQRWEQIFQHAGWGVAIADAADNTLQALNPAFAAMHGYSVAELHGKSLFEVFAPESHGQVEVELQKADDTGHHIYESLHIRKDGTQFPVLADIGAFKDSDGKVLYRAGNYQDITERKRLEQSLRQQTQALQQADRHKDEFLAILGHELRNSLAPLLNAVEVLRLLGSEEPSPVQVKAVVERQVKQMVRLVDDLLDLSRISRGQVELRKERHALATVIAQAVEISAPGIEALGHRLSVDLPAEPLWLLADQTRLVQVIANLLNNAAKYTNSGGAIWVTATREQDQAVIRVRDNGVGIPPEKLDAVFNLFMQIDLSRERSQGGLGVGLALVRQLVELHGGKVAAHSAGPGQGSEFTVTLPLCADAAEQASALAVPTGGPNVGRHVLIVEDNADGRKTLETLLTLLGHRTDAAEDGPQGVAKALALRPEVALIDIGLPNLDGYQVARQLRAALGDAIYLIALTGFGQPEDRRRTREAGFDAHLVKPVDTAELSRLLTGLSGG